MAVSYVGTAVIDGNDFGAGTGTTTIDPPTGISAGDLILITVATDVVDNGSPIYPTSNYSNAAGIFGYNIYWPQCRSYWKNAGSSESAQEFSTASNTYQCWTIAYAFRGHDSTSPIGNTADGSDDAGGSNPYSYSGTAGVTVQNAGSMVVAAVGFYVTTGASDFQSATPPTGMTTVASQALNWNGLTVARQAADAGAWTPGSNFVINTLGSDLAHFSSQTFEIKPGLSGVPPHTRKFFPDPFTIFHNPR